MDPNPIEKVRARMDSAKTEFHNAIEDIKAFVGSHLLPTRKRGT